MNNFYEKGLFAPILNKKKYRVMKITVAILTFALFHVAAIASYAQREQILKLVQLALLLGMTSRINIRR